MRCFGELSNRQRRIEIALCICQCALDTVGFGLELQQRRKLRLAAGTAVIDHQLPGHGPGDVRAETGQSPAKAVENLRLEAARLMMEQSRHPIDIIARQTGFADRDRMRRAFLRAFGQPPQEIRRNARADVAA